MLKRGKVPVSAVTALCWVKWGGHGSAELNHLCLLQEQHFRGTELGSQALALMEMSWDFTQGPHVNQQDA